MCVYHFIISFGTVLKIKTNHPTHNTFPTINLLQKAGISFHTDAIRGFPTTESIVLLL